MKKIFLAIIVLVTTSTLQAAIWRVSNTDPTVDFNSLDAAMTTIVAGDTLYLEGSTIGYSFTNPITTKVTIIGTGYFLTENPNTLENRSPATINGNVFIQVDGVVFEGVTFYSSSGTTQGVAIGADDVILRRCCVTGYLGINDNNNNMQSNVYNTTIMQCYLQYGIGVASGDNAYNAIVVNNILPLQNILSSGISGLKNSIIENNTLFTSTNGKIVGNNGCTIKNNIVSQTDTELNSANPNCNVSHNYIQSSSGNDFINATGASTDGRWQLMESSSGMTAGTNNSQCGAFGGASPYVLSGLPNIPHIYEINAPTSASPASGLPVIIRISTEN